MTFQPSKLPAHNPPGNLPEMSAEVRALWSSDYISYWMHGEIIADPEVVREGRTELRQFFNGTETAYDQSQGGHDVTWNGFPNLVKSAYPDDDTRWAIADLSRMVQDEYLEWSFSKNDQNEITRATFTCEGPEYWQVFASYQEEDFLKVVREINPGYKMNDEDFFLVDPKTGNKIYNPANPWNIRSTTGAILHLLQPNNTLSAEIDIAAQGTVLRKNDKGPVTDPDSLILCSAYGNPGRNSDPVIGGHINVVAAQGNSVSVADPVAIYMHQFNTGIYKLDYATTDDDGDLDLRDISNPDDIFIWQRGDIKQKQGLRLMVQIPPGTKGKFDQDLTVSNIYDTTTQRHIKYAAQFADNFLMGVKAVVIAMDPVDRIPCYKDPSAKAQPLKTQAQESVSVLAADSKAEQGSVAKAPFPFPKTAGRKDNW